MTESGPLSSRENDVLKLLLEGKSNKLIASALHISVSTVEFHLRNIYAKFQVGSRMELILKLRQSTVAGEGETAENREMPTWKNWVETIHKHISRIGKEFKMENTVDGNVRDEGTPMTFFEAIRVCFRKYAEFQGRASRPEFWWFALFVTLAVSAFVYVNEALASVFLIAVLLPFLAVSTRRLRDSGKSGWWTLFLLVPVGGIVLLGFYWALPPANPFPEDAQAV